jgi:hypothetical protein
VSGKRGGPGGLGCVCGYVLCVLRVCGEGKGYVMIVVGSFGSLGDRD